MHAQTGARTVATTLLLQPDRYSVNEEEERRLVGIKSEKQENEPNVNFSG